MKQKTRYNIRLAQKKEVVVRPSQDLEGFHRMLLVTGGRDGFGVHGADYYRRAYDLFHRHGHAVNASCCRRNMPGSRWRR